MSRTIEAIITHMAPLKRSAMTNTKPLTANWQNGFASGTHVQRKVRLTFGNVATHPPAN